MQKTLNWGFWLGLAFGTLTSILSISLLFGSLPSPFGGLNFILILIFLQSIATAVRMLSDTLGSGLLSGILFVLFQLFIPALYGNLIVSKIDLNQTFPSKLLWLLFGIFLYLALNAGVFALLVPHLGDLG
ncbi:MAG: hypothetical protein WC924_02660 [Candidatus Gracilibacteria bacterium]